MKELIEWISLHPSIRIEFETDISPDYIFIVMFDRNSRMILKRIVLKFIVSDYITQILDNMYEEIQKGANNES